MTFVQFMDQQNIDTDDENNANFFYSRNTFVEEWNLL